MTNAPRTSAIEPARLALTNGLDEGIFAASMAYLRPLPDGSTPEAVVPQPAFEIFELNASVAGGRPIPVAPRAEFVFALDEVLAAITPRTRVVFLTNPNNPTGVSMPMEDIKTIAGGVPERRDRLRRRSVRRFRGRDVHPGPAGILQRDCRPHLRQGARPGGPSDRRPGRCDRTTLAPVRQAIGVYSVNIAAVVALRAALADRAHVTNYLDQVRESKALVYAACERLGLKYWKSDANFVLVRTGGRTDALASAAASRGIYLRDRGSEPGCEGCIRITTGIVEHTRAGLAVLEEVLCAAP